MGKSARSLCASSFISGATATHAWYRGRRGLPDEGYDAPDTGAAGLVDAEAARERGREDRRLRGDVRAERVPAYAQHEVAGRDHEPREPDVRREAQRDRRPRALCDCGHERVRIGIAADDAVEDDASASVASSGCWTMSPNRRSTESESAVSSSNSL